MHPVIILESERRVLKLMLWGLVPFWAKDTNIGYRVINAWAEGIESKTSFREPFKKRRCLVLADGFYEWKKLGTKLKVPYFIRLKSGAPFALAGLWDRWNKEEEPLKSFKVIATENNELIMILHNGMPVILQHKDEALWLDPELKNPEKLLPLLKPYPS
jgi:putative SOS response-associated peptidase YedK